MKKESEKDPLIMREESDAYTYIRSPVWRWNRELEMEAGKKELFLNYLATRYIMYKKPKSNQISFYLCVPEGEGLELPGKVKLKGKQEKKQQIHLDRVKKRAPSFTKGVEFQEIVT